MSDDRFEDPNTFKPATEKLAWDGITLKEFLFLQFDRGEIKSPEIKAMVSVFGKEKLRAFYEEWKKARGKG